MTPPDALLCDECGHLLDRRTGHPNRATWRLEGVDRDGRTYRAATCERHVELAEQLVHERAGIASLAPVDSPTWAMHDARAAARARPARAPRPVRDDDYGAGAGAL